MSNVNGEITIVPLFVMYFQVVEGELILKSAKLAKKKKGEVDDLS